jgi:hypothetical protein
MLPFQTYLQISRTFNRAQIEVQVIKDLTNYGQDP